MKDNTYKIYIDTGGTFTDCIAELPNSEMKYCKVLSSSKLRGVILKVLKGGYYQVSEAWHIPDDLIVGYSFYLLNSTIKDEYKVTAYDACDKVLGLNKPLPDCFDYINQTFEVTAHEEAPVLGIRILTNTLLNGTFPNMEVKLGSTKGTNALLESKGAKTALFVTSGFKDLLKIGTQQRPNIFAMQINKPIPLTENIYEVNESIDKHGNIETNIDEGEVLNFLDEIKNSGIESIAIALINSYKHNVHELFIKKLAIEKGFKYISVSSELNSLIKYLDRLETATVNAYLTPVIHDYLNNIALKLGKQKLRIMTSAGSLISKDLFQPKDSLLSGPAGGIVGAAKVGELAGENQLISFDMGGTSTDASRYHNEFEYVFEQQIGNAHIMSTAIAIETVAAGGGSICGFDGHKLFVGPESAGANPGPACYGAGGPLTITDINLLCGRLLANNFSIPVYLSKAEIKLKELVKNIEKQTGHSVDKDVILKDFLEIANEIMAGAIKKISVSKGYSPSEYCMVSFGGAGGLHACGIAELLDINKVLLPREAGLLSAHGIGNAKAEIILSRQVLKELNEFESEIINSFNEMLNEGANQLINEGVGAENIEAENRLLFLRFKGQDSSLKVRFKNVQSILTDFKELYIKQYGNWIENSKVEVETIRIIISEKKKYSPIKTNKPTPYKPNKLYIENTDTSVYQLSTLNPGAQIEGPCIVLDDFSTIYIDKQWTAVMNSNFCLELIRENELQESKNTTKEAELELFTNRFMAIAENMGAILQRTAMSVNIKERLDFSCALLDENGYLVANAPHIPVHLGGLGICVRTVLKTHKFNPGDVLVTNHPAYGGSHLPDVTLISPVFYQNELIGFVVNRAHHSEIGGISPGSMPPAAKNLEEEGVVIPPFLLCENGITNWDGIRGLLENAPYPTRSIEENIADLNAALAANIKGANELLEMCEKYGSEKVKFNFKALKDYAESRMRNAIQNIEDKEYTATEYLDNDAMINVKIKVENDKCTIDFTGSAPVQPNNLNATNAIVNSVVIYVLRLLLNEKIPLNDGLLNPVEIILPDGMLNPDFNSDPAHCPAVVGGNVEISQRLTDTLLKALELMAGSQGTMNNILFGNESFGYYETLAGGTGAGNGFNGADAVHHHMTNTRITDPEIIEHRFPVKIRQMAIRKDSMGTGKYNGGNGLTRVYEFLAPINLSVLTQRRKSGPYGLSGGKCGKPGFQYVLRKKGKKIDLKSIDYIDINKGDKLFVNTPGGGGYGK